MSPKVFRLILCDTFGSYLFLIKIVPYHWMLISFLEFTVSSVIYIIIYKIDLTSLFAEKIAETSRFQNRIHSLQCMNYKALWFQQLFHPPCLISLTLTQILKPGLFQKLFVHTIHNLNLDVHNLTFSRQS